jgi:outer membrane protein insertion porin family
MRVALRLAAAVFLCAAVLAAQQQQKYPLREIEIEGAKNFDRDRIAALTELKVGAMVDKNDFDRALAKLDDAGVFETIQYRYTPQDGGFKLTITVQEVEQLYPVRLDGFKEPPEELMALLREKVPLFAERVPSTGTMALRIGNALQQHWSGSGEESKIIGRLAPIEDGKLAMLFQPETELQTIAFVTFEGSQAIHPLELQREFNPTAMGEAYSKSRLMELLHFNIRPMFEEKGRMDVKFEEVEVKPDPGSSGLLIKVAVTDGPAYTYGSVQKPDAFGLPEETVNKIFKFDTGDPVDMKLVRDAQGELDERYRRNGYLHADTKLETKLDKEAHTVDLAWTVNPGPQYTLRKLNIKGLDILSEPVVRKRWGMELGDPFDAAYPGYFLDRIRAEQMFDNLENTKWTREIDETTKTVEVTLVFEGKTPQKDGIPDVPVENPFP